MNRISLSLFIHINSLLVIFFCKRGTELEQQVSKYGLMNTQSSGVEKKGGGADVEVWEIVLLVFLSWAPARTLAS